MNMRHKRIGLTLTALTCATVIIAGSLTACGSKEKSSNKVGKNQTTTESATEVTTQEIKLVSAKPSICEAINVPNVYKDVLEGKEKIVYGDLELDIIEYINYSEDNLNETMDDSYEQYYIPVHINSYMLSDINNDGVEEVILNLEGTNGGIAILHYEKGKVYGYDKVYAQNLSTFKTEGIYIEGDDFDKRIIKLNIENEKMTQTTLAEKDNKKYYVNEVSCSKKEFKQFEEDIINKENVVSHKVVTPISVTNKNNKGIINICKIWGLWEGSYEFDFNKDGKVEKLDIESGQEGELRDQEYTYKILINNKEVFKVNGESLDVKIIDINTKDSEYELVVSSAIYDDIINFGIYRVTKEGLTCISRDIRDNHIYIYTSGDGILRTEYDSFARNVGCFFISKDYQYEGGELVDITNNNINDIYEFNNNSAKNEYELNKELKVYDSLDLKKEIATLKKGSTIKIRRIHSNGFEEMDGYKEEKYDAAEVVVDGEVLGWIEIPREYYELGEGLFTEDSMPAWD